MAVLWKYQVYSSCLHDNSWPWGFSSSLAFSHQYLRKLTNKLHQRNLFPGCKCFSPSALQSKTHLEIALNFSNEEKWEVDKLLFWIMRREVLLRGKKTHMIFRLYSQWYLLTAHFVWGLQLKPGVFREDPSHYKSPARLSPSFPHNYTDLWIPLRDQAISHLLTSTLYLQYTSFSSSCPRPHSPQSAQLLLSGSWFVCFF